MQDVQELLAGSTRRHRLLDGSLLVGLALGAQELLAAESLGVGVEAEEDGLVAEGVLLLGEGAWTGQHYLKNDAGVSEQYDCLESERVSVVGTASSCEKGEKSEKSGM